MVLSNLFGHLDSVKWITHNKQATQIIIFLKQKVLYLVSGWIEIEKKKKQQTGNIKILTKIFEFLWSSE